MENNKESTFKKNIISYLKINFNLKNNITRLIWFLVAAVIVLVPAFVMRSWALNSNSQTYGNPNDFISIYITFNTGVGFSLLNNATWAVYLLESLISLIILIVVVFVHKWYYLLLLSVAFFGGLSNIIDRIIPDYFLNSTVFTENPYQNAVIDYFKFSFNFGIFNIADVFICAGMIGSAVLMIIFSIISTVKDVKNQKQPKKGKSDENNHSK